MYRLAYENEHQQMYWNGKTFTKSKSTAYEWQSLADINLIALICEHRSQFKGKVLDELLILNVDQASKQHLQKYELANCLDDPTKNLPYRLRYADSKLKSENQFWQDMHFDLTYGRRDDGFPCPVGDRDYALSEFREVWHQLGPWFNHPQYSLLHLQVYDENTDKAIWTYDDQMMVNQLFTSKSKKAKDRMQSKSLKKQFSELAEFYLELVKVNDAGMEDYGKRLSDRKQVLEELSTKINQLAANDHLTKKQRKHFKRYYQGIRYLMLKNMMLDAFFSSTNVSEMSWILRENAKQLKLDQQTAKNLDKLLHGNSKVRK